MQTQVQRRSVFPSLEQDHLHMTVVRLLTDEIAPSRKHPGFFDYPFELAALPQAAWTLEFKAAYDAIQVEGKGEVHLAGARIIARVLADDDKQHRNTGRHGAGSHVMSNPTPRAWFRTRRIARDPSCVIDVSRNGLRLGSRRNRGHRRGHRRRNALSDDVGQVRVNGLGLCTRRAAEAEKNQKRPALEVTA